MLVNFKSYTDYLHELIDQNPSEVIIATYNVFAGILFDGDDVHKWGAKYHNEIHVILDKLAKLKNVKILAGLPPLIFCRENCEDCLAKQAKSMKRLNAHANNWPTIKWRFAHDFHLKCNIFKIGNSLKGIAGGRNLTTSNWVDISFKIGNDRCKVIKYLFDKVWNDALPISEENLEAAILKQMAINEKEA